MKAKTECIFKGCSRAAKKNGVCATHELDGLALAVGQSPRCSHGALWSDACDDCERKSATRALSDANAVDAAKQGRIDADLRARDAVLRLLSVELTRRDIPNRLGPNGGVPIATHLGVTPKDGRVYRVDVDEANAEYVALAVCWGSRLMIRAGGFTGEVVGAVTTFFAGAHSRGTGN